ncbi:hypothetical protein INT45_000222 [Circinella minor]|uniref:Uncharacterized protein n=1 Tax=Circinella minor TaxID=1195481 RepID=A0A8H7S0I1_9FUNG|nr:hypothetical protein INT45_000222 [Circinella minor]
MQHPQQPPFIDHDKDSWHDFMASEDDVWGNPMEEPPYGWERIEEDPFMDMVGPPPHHDFEAANNNNKKDKKKKDKHRHKDKHSSSSSSSTTSDINDHHYDKTATATEDNETAQPTITPESESESIESTVEPTKSSLVESPVIVNNSPSPSSSPIMTSVTEENDNNDNIAEGVSTSFVISTVYAINTVMPGSYPHIDYNGVDYRQLGQIGVFTDGGSHEFHVASFWSSFVVAFVVLFMIRVI